jgi:hypothetical protein
LNTSMMVGMNYKLDRGMHEEMVSYCNLWEILRKTGLPTVLTEFIHSMS